MKITTVELSPQTVYKIHNKHGIQIKEIKNVLLGEHYVSKTKYGRYVAIGKYARFITVVFNCEQGIAEIITAYPSSEWQIRLYKTKKWR